MKVGDLVNTVRFGLGIVIRVRFVTGTCLVLCAEGKQYWQGGQSLELVSESR